MTAMNTAPRPFDHFKRNFLSIIALGLGLLLGYGFGASRSNYAIVYAPAPSVPQGVIDSAATAAAPSLPVASGSALRPSADALAAGAAPVKASVAASPAAARSESVSGVAAQAPSRRASSAAHLNAVASGGDMTAHEKTSAFISKSGEQKLAAPAPASKPAALAAAAPKAPEAPVHSVAAETGAIRYGAATRGEIMGRGAGPVYNFGETGAGAGSAISGSAGGSATPTTTTSATAADQALVQGAGQAAMANAAAGTSNALDAARQQIEKMPLSPEMRQRLTTSLNASKSATQEVTAGQPGQ